jgi:hypothetical protein
MSCAQQISVNRVNAAQDGRGTLRVMGIIAMIGLMLLTLGAAYALWSLLLRAERVFTQLEGHGQTAADIAGVTFFALAAVIVLSASVALLFEARRLVSAILAT